MTSNTNVKLATAELCSSYKNNFARHLLGVSRYQQLTTMQRLSEDYGYRHLRLGFEPYLSLIGAGSVRITELAERLEISKQAANQTANQIEKAGLLERQADPLDGRARRIVLTPQGQQLQLDGLQVSADIQAGYASLVSAEDLSSLTQYLVALDDALLLTSRGTTDFREGVHVNDVALLAGLLPRLADYTSRRLMALTMLKGHPQLKPSFGHVLNFIGPEGGRIHQMAAMQKISKQAVSATAGELDSLGYIDRQADPKDARQLVIYFTELGQRLISDSVGSVNDLKAEFQAIIGGPAVEDLERIFFNLYQGLNIEAEVFSAAGAVDIQALAQQLKAQLGEKGVQALVASLLQP